MTEENKFKEVDSIQLYNDYIGYVKLYDASHANESEEQRQYTVATIASLAYGSDEAKNPAALYERLKVLHHESCFEFIRWGRGIEAYGIETSLRHLPNMLTINEHNKRFNESYNSISYNTFITEHKQNIACFRIKVPIFVARQFMRHRSFSYLEISRRYTKGAKVPFEFWFPKNFTKDTAHQNDWVQAFNKTYESIIEQGYETQVASRFLPQTTYTEFYVMGEVEGLRNFLNLRLDSHAQAEIRVVAEAMLALLVQHQAELANKVIV
jgi:hypothetical protein